MLERILDIAADELGIDPVEIRRRNFIPPEAFPLTTVTGAQLRHRRVREGARRGAAESPATTSCAPSRRRAASAATRMQLGIGVCVLRRDHAPAGCSSEYGAVEIDDDGTVTATRRHVARTARATRPRSR